MRKGIATAAIAAIVSVLLFGCASEQTRKAEYKRATTLPPLEVPPDLTAPELHGDMELPQTAAAQAAVDDGSGVRVLPAQQDVRVLRDGTMHWLEVDAEPEQLWARLRDFWQQQGLEVQRDEPHLGIMETQWAENKADVPGDWIQSMISRVFKSAYSAPTRDKFRLRVERGSAAGSTEIYVTHYGVEEVMRGQSVESYDTIWQSRPSDPELVTEMLNRLMVFLGTPQAVAESRLAAAPAAAPGPRAQLEGGTLVVNEAYPRAWRRVGIALDRLGLVVEDRDRSAGVYYIRPVDQVKDSGKKGFFSGLFSGKEDATAPASAPARIHLEESGDITRVVVQNQSGQRDTSKAGLKILEQLETELR